jgi:hypothetical protein
MSSVHIQALFEFYAGENVLTPALKLNLILTVPEIQRYFVKRSSQKTRSGRVSKPPSRFSDQKFVKGSGTVKRRGYDHTDLSDDE